MEVLLVVLGSDMLPDVILLWRIMVTEMTLPQRIARVFLCYMQCKISITVTLFTTVAFSFIRDKNCRGTPFGVVSWIFDIDLIAPVLCVDIFVTRLINASSDFFCEPFLLALHLHPHDHHPPLLLPPPGPPSAAFHCQMQQLLSFF